MNTLQEEFNAKNLTIIAVSVDDDESSMMSAIKNVRPKYTVVRDAEKTFIGRIDPPKMPTSYLVNPEGEVIFVHEGFAAGDELVVGNKIREALQGQEK
jgi:peroxiredoxin